MVFSSFYYNYHPNHCHHEQPKTDVNNKNMKKKKNNSAALPNVETITWQRWWGLQQRRQRRHRRGTVRRWSTPGWCSRRSCRCKNHSRSGCRIHGRDCDHGRGLRDIHIHRRSSDDHDRDLRRRRCCWIWEFIQTWKTRRGIFMRTKIHPFLPTRCGIIIIIGIMGFLTHRNNMPQNSNNSNNRKINMQSRNLIIITIIIDNVTMWGQLTRWRQKATGMAIGMAFIRSPEPTAVLVVVPIQVL